MTFWRSGRFSHAVGFALLGFLVFEGGDGVGEGAREEEAMGRSEAEKGGFRSGLDGRWVFSTRRRFLKGDLLEDEDGAGGIAGAEVLGEVHSTSTLRTDAAVSTAIADAAVEDDDD